MTNSLEARNLSFSFGEKVVLNEVSLSAKTGELHAVVGMNGCGKSTLLRLLCGILSPKEGSVLLEGQPLTALGRREIARRIGFFPQSRPLPEMTVEELVLCGRYPWGERGLRPSKETTHRVKAALAAAEAEAFAARPLHTLSGGERQKAYLALLLSQDPPFLLLDEPGTFLDAASQFSLYALLRRLAQEGHGVVSVLHDLPAALRYAHRISVLKEGRLLQSGTPGELLSSGVIPEAFGVECIPVEKDGWQDYILCPLKSAECK